MFARELLDGVARDAEQPRRAARLRRPSRRCCTRCFVDPARRERLAGRGHFVAGREDRDDRPAVDAAPAEAELASTPICEGRSTGLPG